MFPNKESNHENLLIFHKFELKEKLYQEIFKRNYFKIDRYDLVTFSLWVIYDLVTLSLWVKYNYTEYKEMYDFLN